MVGGCGVAIHLAKDIDLTWGELAGQRFDGSTVLGEIEQAEVVALQALLPIREDLLLERHNRQILVMTACRIEFGRPRTPRHLIHQVVEDEAIVALLIKLGSRLW